MSNEKGATTLEAAITIGPFLLFVLGLFHLCVICYTAFSLQYNLVVSARNAAVLTGNDKYNTIKTDLTNKLKTFGIGTADLTFNVCNGVVEQCDKQESGLSNEFVTLQASVPGLELLGHKFIVAAQTITKNEPY